MSSHLHEHHHESHEHGDYNDGKAHGHTHTHGAVDPQSLPLSAGLGHQMVIRRTIHNRYSSDHRRHPLRQCRVAREHDP